LRGIPIDKVLNRKKQSQMALRAMRDIENQKQGGSLLRWLLWTALIIVIFAAIIRFSL
jgi:hypothetical protein